MTIDNEKITKILRTLSNNKDFKLSGIQSGLLDIFESGANVYLKKDRRTGFSTLCLGWAIHSCYHGGDRNFTFFTCGYGDYVKFLVKKISENFRYTIPDSADGYDFNLNGPCGSIRFITVKTPRMIEKHMRGRHFKKNDVLVFDECDVDKSFGTAYREAIGEAQVIFGNTLMPAVSNAFYHPLVNRKSHLTTLKWYANLDQAKDCYFVREEDDATMKVFPKGEITPDIILKYEGIMGYELVNPAFEKHLEHCGMSDVYKIDMDYVSIKDRLKDKREKGPESDQGRHGCNSYWYFSSTEPVSFDIGPSYHDLLSTIRRIMI